MQRSRIDLMDKKRIKPKIPGWVAVGISTLISSVWAFWGIIENFHEGWYFESIWLNLGMMMLQYLSPMLVFMSVSLISIFWPRLGGGLHGLIALFAIWFFNAFSNAATFLIIIPLVGLGVMYWFGRPKSKSLAAYLVVGLPLLTFILGNCFP